MLVTALLTLSIFATCFSLPGASWTLLVGAVALSIYYVTVYVDGFWTLIWAGNEGHNEYVDVVEIWDNSKYVLFAHTVLMVAASAVLSHLGFAFGAGISILGAFILATSVFAVYRKFITPEEEEDE